MSNRLVDRGHCIELQFDDKIMDIKIIYSIMDIHNSVDDIHDSIMDIERYP